jgi:neutral ceramidase
LKLCAVLLAGVSAAAGLSAQATWKAGAAKVDITPARPIWLAGYAARDHPSDGVIHPIYVKALALQDESGAISVLVTSDLVGIDRAMLDEIDGAAEQKFGLPTARLIINYSHNHTCPVAGKALETYYPLDAKQQKAVDAYTRALTRHFLEAIGAAIQDLAPASVSFGQGFAGFAVNRRRTAPGGRSLPGPVDPDVPVLSVRGLDGSMRAILFGYACHNTAVGGYKISGDFVGFAQSELEKLYPGAVALFMEGCGGDQNPLPRYNALPNSQSEKPEVAHWGVELASMYGKILAAATDLVLHGPIRPISGPIRAAFDRIDVPFQQTPSRQELALMLKDAPDDFHRRQYRLLLTDLQRKGGLQQGYPYPVAVWRFADSLTLIALGGEPVVDYSLRFKSRYGWETTWVSGYTSELVAYIPSLRVAREGGYEGGAGVREYGLPSPFSYAMEELIAGKVDDLFRATGGQQ